MTELDPLVGMDDPTKPLRSRLLQVPALRAKYLENLRTLGAEMSWDRMAPVVARLHDLVATRVARDTRKAFTTEAFERDTSSDAAGSLRQFLEKRSKFLLERNPSPALPAASGGAGSGAARRKDAKD